LRVVTRDHQATRLERHFRPLFLLAGLDRLWPVKTRDQEAAVWQVARELRAAVDRAGFHSEQLAREKDLGVDLRRFLWKPRDDAPTRAMRSPASQIAWHIDTASSWLQSAFPQLRRADKEAEGVGLLEALSKSPPGLREHLRQYVRSGPTIAARIAFGRGEARLVPDPENLGDVICILAAELIEGGWLVRRCAAPKCAQYVGQWTKRERLFCNERCRTAYHNARRNGQGKGTKQGRPRGRPRRTFGENVPANVPASTRNQPKTTPRQPRAKKKTPR
jgi:hypothetical protein